MSSSSTEEAISQITCCALPNGGIGFLSHILTYYSIICVGLGVRPLLPGLAMKHRLITLTVAVVSLIITSVPSIITMARCHKEWQFLLLTLWKFPLSITANMIGTHRYILTSDDRRKKPTLPFLWLILYIVGMVLGLMGLISLVSETWSYRPVRAVTGAFLGIAIGFGFISALVIPVTRYEEIYIPREPQRMQYI